VWFVPRTDTKSLSVSPCTVLGVCLTCASATVFLGNASFCKTLFFLVLAAPLGGIIWCIHPSGGRKECCAPGLRGVPMEFYIDFPVCRSLRI